MTRKTRRLLPPDVGENLKCAVKQATSHALGGSRTEYNPSVLHRAGQKRTLKLISEIRRHVDEALLELCRDFNTQNTLVGRLCDELLCLVFSFLPTEHLISASHVCTKWRSVALADPALWCRIDYELDYHDEKCDCNRSLLWGYRGGCRYDDEVVGSASLRRVLDMLPRAGSTLPVSLDVEIPRDLVTASGDLKRLARALQSYAPRIAALYFRADDVDLPAYFLQHFDSLPALRTLSVQWLFSPRSGPPAGGAQFLLKPLDLPALKTLEVATKPAHGDKKCLADTLPSLTSLDFRFVKTRDIMAYLTIAPRLRKLRLQCPEKWRAEADEAYERVRAHMPAGDVAVVDIVPDIEPAILAMFDSAAHASILLGYLQRYHQTPPAGGMRILGHLKSVDELSVTRRPAASRFDPEPLIISARGPAGQVRTITGFWTDAVVLSDMWDNLAAPPRSLVMDALQWWVSEEMAAGVKTLTVPISSECHLTELLDDDAVLPTPFVALEELKITAQPGVDVPPVSSVALEDFLQFLSVPGGVSRLVLNNIKIDGDTEKLKALAHTVVFQ